MRIRTPIGVIFCVLLCLCSRSIHSEEPTEPVKIAEPVPDDGSSPPPPTREAPPPEDGSSGPGEPTGFDAVWAALNITDQNTITKLSLVMPRVFVAATLAPSGKAARTYIQAVSGVMLPRGSLKIIRNLILNDEVRLPVSVRELIYKPALNENEIDGILNQKKTEMLALGPKGFDQKIVTPSGEIREIVPPSVAVYVPQLLARLAGSTVSRIYTSSSSATFQNFIETAAERYLEDASTLYQVFAFKVIQNAAAFRAGERLTPEGAVTLRTLNVLSKLIFGTGVPTNPDEVETFMDKFLGRQIDPTVNWERSVSAALNMTRAQLLEETAIAKRIRAIYNRLASGDVRNIKYIMERVANIHRAMDYKIQSIKMLLNRVSVYGLRLFDAASLAYRIVRFYNDQRQLMELDYALSKAAYDKDYFRKVIIEPQPPDTRPPGGLFFMDDFNDGNLDGWTLKGPDPQPWEILRGELVSIPREGPGEPHPYRYAYPSNVKVLSVEKVAVAFTFKLNSSPSGASQAAFSLLAEGGLTEGLGDLTLSWDGVYWKDKTVLAYPGLVRLPKYEALLLLRQEEVVGGGNGLFSDLYINGRLFFTDELVELPADIADRAVAALRSSNVEGTALIYDNMFVAAYPVTDFEDDFDSGILGPWIMMGNPLVQWMFVEGTIGALAAPAPPEAPFLLAVADLADQDCVIRFDCNGEDCRLSYRGVHLDYLEEDPKTGAAGWGWGDDNPLVNRFQHPMPNPAGVWNRFVLFVRNVENGNPRSTLYLNGSEVFTNEPIEKLLFDEAKKHTGFVSPRFGAAQYDNFRLVMKTSDGGLPPLFTTRLGPFTVKPGDQVNFLLQALDADASSELTYSTGALPAGATLDPKRGVFSWTPTSGLAGNTFDIEFTVRDEKSSDRQIVRIIVEAADRDGDGIPDNNDPCPDDPTNTCNPDPDTDRDGLPDSRDPCPTNPDCDRDGLVDGVDPCPLDPDPRCGPAPTPPPDADRDGIPDPEDPCPFDPDPQCVPEPIPPPDTDRDGIPDAEDACPKDPGPASADPRLNGCPV